MAEDKRFLLRLDPATFRSLKRWADDELRSVNGQIEFLLRRALRDAGRTRGSPRGPADGGAGEEGDGGDA